MKKTITIQDLKDYTDARFEGILKVKDASERSNRMDELAKILDFINQKLDEE